MVRAAASRADLFSNDSDRGLGVRYGQHHRPVSVRSAELHLTCSFISWFLVRMCPPRLSTVDRGLLKPLSHACLCSWPAVLPGCVLYSCSRCARPECNRHHIRHRMSILDRSKHMRDALAATHHPLMCMMEEEIAQGGAETAQMEAEKALVAELERAKEVGKLEANSAAKSCARLS